MRRAFGPVGARLGGLLLAALSCACLAAPGIDAATAGRIDRIFAPFVFPRTPGCALAITRRGEVVYEKGYGTANLELGVPITPRSVFDIGSVSKQFTAMSVVLLALDGRLALDDEIHRYLPELSDYGVPVTLRQMLHHLSGLPNYSDLFDLAGVPEENLTGDADALALVARQRALNFPPGRQYLYSDSNYFLLSLVVRRVSGQSLRTFAAERIFGPLGMTSTHFHDDHRQPVPHRAQGYAPRADGGFDIDMSNFEQLGDGAVLTTVQDLARWIRNFREPKVGGQRAIELLQQVGARSDGSATPYAMGLIRDRYRGVERIQHTGEWVGYRSSLLRFPGQNTGIVVLCNEVGEVDPLALSERVADLVLDPASLAPRLDLPVPAKALAAFAGDYGDEALLAYRRFLAVDGALLLDDEGNPLKLRYLGEGRFEAGNSATRYEFFEKDGRPMVRAISDDFDPPSLVRLARAPAGRATADVSGLYESADLGVSWRLEVREGRLFRHQPLYPEQELEAFRPDVFMGELSEGRYTLRFTRDAKGSVDGFDVAGGLVRPLHFVRIPGVARPN